MYIALIFITLTFGFIILNAINNKRFSFVSVLLFIISLFYYLSYSFNNIYYTKLCNLIDNVNFYYKIFCIVALIVSFFEYIIGYKKINHEEISNQDQLKNVPLSDVQYSHNILAVFIEMIDEPLAFYFDDEYLINSSMKKNLNIDKYIITSRDMSELIYSKDIENFNNDKKQLMFRFKSNENKWFEETSITVSDKKYKVIRQASYNDNRINLHSFKELNYEVKMLNSELKNYSLIFLSINNTKEIKSKYDKDFLDLVIHKYLCDIIDIPFLNEIKIYYISFKEYVILIEDKAQYEMILSSFEDDTSIILYDEILISKTIVGVKSKVGIISKKDVNDPTLIISKGYDMLKLACSEDYPGDFAIYNEIDENIDFSSLNTDINLEKYKKRIK